MKTLTGILVGLGLGTIVTFALTKIYKVPLDEERIAFALDQLPVGSTFLRKVIPGVTSVPKTEIIPVGFKLASFSFELVKDEMVAPTYYFWEKI